MPKIETPIIAITGDKDVQVPPSDLVKMKESIKSNITTLLVPNITHMLREDLGEPTIYNYKSQLKHPVDNQILNSITEWILNT